jgi:chaperonin cofactor prefoldin
MEEKMEKLEQRIKDLEEQMEDIKRNMLQDQLSMVVFSGGLDLFDEAVFCS